MSKQIVTRVLDAGLIAALILGSAGVKTFAFWMVTIMVVLLFVGCFAVDAAMAEKIQGRSFGKKAFGALVNLAYVAALIYAGFPVLAAVYAMSAFLIRTIAQTKLNGVTP
jgi:general stress protein CsbA